MKPFTLRQGNLAGFITAPLGIKRQCSAHICQWLYLMVQKDLFHLTFVLSLTS